jgi:hypothetical protein
VLWFEDLAEITHVNPSAAFLALDEVFGFIGRRQADTLSDVFSARNAGHGGTQQS